MRLIQRISIGVLVGGWTWLALAGAVMAQGNAAGTTSDGWVAKGDWQRRVVQGAPSTHAGPEQARVDAQRALQWSPSRPGQIRTASRAKQLPAEEIPPGEEQPKLTPLPKEEPPDAVEMGEAEMYGPLADDAGGCGECYEGCGPAYGGYGTGLSELRSAWWARDLSLLGGAQAFKGPFDHGRNGNFGLHEGVEFGAPLGGPWGWGYQVGFAALQSNFSGDQATGLPRRGTRDQLFFSAGIFHRALCGGIQWGVTFDLLRDTYYAKVDLKQIRNEIGYVFSNGQGEIGYWGAYGTADDDVILDDRHTSFEPTDLFAGYYRRRFESGGEGRLWGGCTGKGDGLLGADFRVPLGRSWALQNRFGYLIPKEGRDAAGQREESWSLSIELVWYIGQSARGAQNSPYRPLLSVADNSVFMFDMVGR